MDSRLGELLSTCVINEEISSKSLFENNEEKLLEKYKDEKTAKVIVGRVIGQAKKLGIIQRCDNTFVPEWFEKLETISYWQSQLRGNKSKNSSNKSTRTTKKTYLDHVWNFNKWLCVKSFEINILQSNTENTFVQKREKKEFKNIQDLLMLLEQPFADQKNITRIIKQYLLDNLHAHKKASYMVLIKSAIESYFEKNEQPLKILFNPKTSHSVDIEDQSISLSEFMEFLTTGKPSILEKTVFLCKFHRGLDVSTFADRFNYEAWGQIVKWFGSEDHDSWDLTKCPVPISLIRIKTDYKHVGFLDRDAIEQLQKYLDFRKMKTKIHMNNKQALFVNKFERPITANWIMKSFSNISKRAGIQKFVEINGIKHYKMNSHELRDLLKSTLIDSGCRMNVADHVIGHKPKDSYEKQAKLYPETLRKEYAKASKRLNIFTKFTNVVNGTDDSDDLKVELNQKIQEINEIKDKFVIESAVKKRDEIFAATT